MALGFFRVVALGLSIGVVLTLSLFFWVFEWLVCLGVGDSIGLASPGLGWR